jgi:hypothetical protein
MVVRHRASVQLQVKRLLAELDVARQQPAGFGKGSFPFSPPAAQAPPPIR